MAKPIKRKSANVVVETDNFSSAIIQLVHDAIIVVDEDQNIVLFNQGAEQTFGYNASEVIGQRLDVLLPPQVSDFHAVYIRSFAKDPETARLMGERKEVSGRRKDGAIFPAEASIAKVSIGERTFFTAIFRDITERKLAEEQMRQLSMAVEQTADCVVITDREGVILYVNAAFEKETGFTREEALGKTPRILKSSEHDSRFYEALWKTILAGNVFKAVFINRKKTGELVYEHKTITPLKDSKGNITHFVSTAKNITEQVQAEKALRENEKQYRDLFESTSDLIQAVAPDGRLLFANRAWREALGYTEQELINLNIDRVVHPEALTQCFETLQRAMSGGGQVDRIETRFVTKEGKSIIVEGSVTCRFEASQPMAITCFLRDITERKRAEAERAQLLNVLEASLNEIFIFDAETLRFQYVNQGALSNLGYTREAISGMTPLDLKPEFDEVSFRNLLVPLLSREREQLIFQTVHRRADASLYPVEVHLQLVEQDGAQVFLAIILDITERRQAEEALRKKDEHHKAVIESIFKFVPEGVLVLTESLNLLKHNKAFDDILQKYAPRLGYAEQELADEIIQQLRSKILGGENTEIRVPKKSK